MTNQEELALYRDADARAGAYIAGIETRRVYPETSAIEALFAFHEALPEVGRPAAETIALLDDVGSPATVSTNGGRYFGFVVGASLPAAAAAERLMVAWDQVISPVGTEIEDVAAGWLLEILDLPRESAVGFGTSATSCGLSVLSTARRALLSRAGWDVDTKGVSQAPVIRAVISKHAHVAIRKALRIMGIGTDDILIAPTDSFGRIIPEQLPPLDARTILCVQAGEVNTGEFDPFGPLIYKATSAGAWVHVDGAFGLWARATDLARHMTAGLEGADSWVVDGHKWLNTPYDCAMAICRHPEELSKAMNSDAVYANGTASAQRNLTLEFSRRARGIPVWAALRTLGKDGVRRMVTGNIKQASRAALALQRAGFEVLNRVVLNQVLVRCATDEETRRVMVAAQASGEVWFGPSVWDGHPAFRLSFSSWRTTDSDVDQLCVLLARLKRQGVPA